MSRLRHAVLWSLVALPLCAAARPLRPRFEPTDLELEEPGVVEVDLQVGVVRSPGPYRLVLPDLEVDIGVLRNLEIDVDWTYALEQPFDHSVQDNVWLSAKIGLIDWGDAARATSWALGVQLGPRLGAAPGSTGGGFEGLALLAHERRRVHAVLSAGALVDPPIGGAYRPVALEAGLNLAVDLDARARFGLTGALGAVYFFSIDPHQLVLSVGGSWTPRPWLSLSLTALIGFLDGDDRFGILVGYSQKLVSARARRE